MRWFLCLLAVFVLWMLLFWSLEVAVIGAGIFFALIIGTLLGDIYPGGLSKVFTPKRWFWSLVYLPVFFYYCVRANIDVMLRVMNPNLPIQPGIVHLRTTLTSEMAKTFLANSITLTPGTLVVDIEGQDLYVHWINVREGDVATRSAAICGLFEPLLRRIFE